MAGGLSPIGNGAPAPLGFGGSVSIPLGGIIYAKALPDTTFVPCDGAAVEITASAFPYQTKPLAVLDAEIVVDPTMAATQTYGSYVTYSTPVSVIDMAFGNGVYVAVGTLGRVWWSTDFKVWTRSILTGVKADMQGDINGVAFGLGGFALVGTNQFVGWTTDGKTIATGTSPGGNTEWFDLIFNPTVGKFVSIGGANSTGSMFLYNAGTGWTAGSAMPGSVVYCQGSTLFVSGVYTYVTNWDTNGYQMFISSNNNLANSWNIAFAPGQNTGSNFTNVFQRADGSVIALSRYNALVISYLVPSGYNGSQTVSGYGDMRAGGQFFAELGGGYLLHDANWGDGKGYGWKLNNLEPPSSNSAITHQPVPAGVLGIRNRRKAGFPNFFYTNKGYRTVRLATKAFLTPTIAAANDPSGNVLNAYMKVA